jgi:hypothetical protein
MARRYSVLIPSAFLALPGRAQKSRPSICPLPDTINSAILIFPLRPLDDPAIVPIYAAYDGIVGIGAKHPIEHRSDAV